MSVRGLRAVVASACLVVVMVTGGATPMVEAASVSITLHCSSNPETVRIVNNTSHSITINSVGSTYRPRSNEPFYVYHTLRSGHSITYQTGYAAYKHVLTRQYIYNNDGDGVRVKTSAGTYTRAC